MKRKIIFIFLIVILCSIALFIFRQNKKVIIAKQSPIDTIMGQGEINPYGKYFTGTTYLNSLLTKDNNYDLNIANVTFEPGSRTNWHYHIVGQILFVLGGEGRYQEKGGEIRILKKGDVVEIGANIEHWHGASPDSWFTHISIMSKSLENETVWLNHVTNKEYK